MLWKEHLKMVLNAAPFSSKLLPVVMNGFNGRSSCNDIRETFDQNDSYSHEVSKSVDDTIELVRAYLK